MLSWDLGQRETRTRGHLIHARTDQDCPDTSDALGSFGVGRVKVKDIMQAIKR